ncbi:hypothetical protein [Microbacterium sp. SORGH_AS_0862]|uniref:hypothetical protein n=1 Tax=Microbacterium sp. SORGH_AS_0862 TaxID=3041789 RepID=UPI0027D81ACB|nr:hypothetical protein [Microbacterium sp. SORGH_AS_0862]
MRRFRTLGAMTLATAALVLTACTAAPDDAAEPSASSSPTATHAPSTAPAPAPAASADTADGPVESFRAWFEATRTPDPAAACAALSPALAERMLAELNQNGLDLTTCEEMIQATSELYRATGQSADVDVQVQSETATDATLFVTYGASGDCGTVVMHRDASSWIITDESRECAG